MHRSGAPAADLKGRWRANDIAVEVKEYVSALERDGRLLIGAAKGAGLDALVPTCPGWHIRELLAHIRYVHAWARAYVAGALGDMVSEPDEVEILRNAPPDHELLESVEDGHAALLGALADAPPSLNCWTFLSSPSPLVMWARRQAHETAIHRVDAEIAAGWAPRAFDFRLAMDGLDEIIFAFLARTVPPAEGEVGLGRIGFEAREGAERLTVRLTAGGALPERGEPPCDLVIRASASDLYLVAWNRPPAGELELIGAAHLLDAWRRLIQVTW